MTATVLLFPKREATGCMDDVVAEQLQLERDAMLRAGVGPDLVDREIRCARSAFSRATPRPGAPR